MKLIQRNYRCPLGEIDLIMRDRHCLVFVEVRYRRQSRFGGALESIDTHKQTKLRRAALHYLNSVNGHGSECRFDILCLQGELHKPDIMWLDNAL